MQKQGLFDLQCSGDNAPAIRNAKHLLIRSSPVKIVSGKSEVNAPGVGAEQRRKLTSD
jgi:hypothetical protein